MKQNKYYGGYVSVSTAVHQRWFHFAQNYHECGLTNHQVVFLNYHLNSKNLFLEDRTNDSHMCEFSLRCKNTKSEVRTCANFHIHIRRNQHNGVFHQSTFFSFEAMRTISYWFSSS